VHTLFFSIAPVQPYKRMESYSTENLDKDVTTAEQRQKLVENFGSRKRHRSMTASMAARISETTRVVGQQNVAQAVEARLLATPTLASVASTSSSSTTATTDAAANHSGLPPLDAKTTIVELVYTPRSIVARDLKTVTLCCCLCCRWFGSDFVSRRTKNSTLSVHIRSYFIS
jgi:hypothetical protein